MTEQPRFFVEPFLRGVGKLLRLYGYDTVILESMDVAHDDSVRSVVKRCLMQDRIFVYVYDNAAEGVRGLAAAAAAAATAASQGRVALMMDSVDSSASPLPSLTCFCPDVAGPPISGPGTCERFRRVVDRFELVAPVAIEGGEAVGAAGRELPPLPPLCESCNTPLLPFGLGSMDGGVTVTSTASPDDSTSRPSGPLEGPHSTSLASAPSGSLGAAGGAAVVPSVSAPTGPAGGGGGSGHDLPTLHRCGECGGVVDVGAGVRAVLSRGGREGPSNASACGAAARVGLGGSLSVAMSPAEIVRQATPASTTSFDEGRMRHRPSIAGPGMGHTSASNSADLRTSDVGGVPQPCGVSLEEALSTLWGAVGGGSAAAQDASLKTLKSFGEEGTEWGRVFAKVAHALPYDVVKNALIGAPGSGPGGARMRRFGSVAMGGSGGGGEGGSRGVGRYWREVLVDVVVPYMRASGAGEVGAGEQASGEDRDAEDGEAEAPWLAPVEA